MAWDSIQAGAVYGAIGGGVGALVGTLLAQFFKRSAHGQLITAALTAGFAVLGLNLAEPILSPYIGKYLPGHAAGEGLEAQISEEFDKANDPLFNAIFAKEPNLKSQLVAEVIDATKGSTNAIAARQLAFAASYNKVSGRFLYYLQRGRPEDLIEFTSSLVDGLESLAMTDPEFCYTYLYNPGGLAGFSLEQVKEKFGGEQFQKQQESAAKVVSNSLNETASYDKNAAAAVIDRAGTRFRNEIGDAGIAIVSRKRHPIDDVEAKLVCDGTILLYRYILADENAGIALVHLYSQNS